ncbi:unnamed protein product [Ascophyllum nodosum]
MCRVCPQKVREHHQVALKLYLARTSVIFRVRHWLSRPPREACLLFHLAIGFSGKTGYHKQSTWMYRTVLHSGHVQPQPCPPLPLLSSSAVDWTYFLLPSPTFKVRYPTMYADKSDTNAEAFNCYQRAHQNILENYPQFLVLLALASVHRPIIAAIAGAIRLMGFVSYALGYQTGDPDKRLRGTFGYIGLLTLLGLSIELAVRLLAS